MSIEVRVVTTRMKRIKVEKKLAFWQEYIPLEDEVGYEEYR